MTTFELEVADARTGEERIEILTAADEDGVYREAQRRGLVVSRIVRSGESTAIAHRRATAHQCANCDRTIGRLETPVVWDGGEVVCAECAQRLSSQPAPRAPSSNSTPQVGRESVLVAIAKAPVANSIFGVLFVVVVLFLVFGAIAAWSNGPRSNSSSPSSVPDVSKAEADEMRAKIDGLVASGTLYSARYTPTVEVRVDPMIWVQLDYNAKRNVVLNAATVGKGYNGAAAAKILSSRSDEVLGEMSPWSGVSINR